MMYVIINVIKKYCAYQKLPLTKHVSSDLLEVIIQVVWTVSTCCFEGIRQSSKEKADKALALQFNSSQDEGHKFGALKFQNLTIFFKESTLEILKGFPLRVTLRTILKVENRFSFYLILMKRIYFLFKIRKQSF